MSWYDKWVLSFLSAGLSIISINVINPSFVKKYKSILKTIVKTADVIRPYIEETEEEDPI
jgi:hypothetical protein